MKKCRLILMIAALLMGVTSAKALEQDGAGNYLIGSVQDWKDFATLVQTTPTANAKMTADIDLGEGNNTRIGDTRQDIGSEMRMPCPYGSKHQITPFVYVFKRKHDLCIQGSRS